MCDPVIGAVIGGGQAALGVMGQNKALAARNKNRALLYGRDLNTIHSKHLENVSNYYLRGVDAEITWDDNLITASQQVDRQQTAVNAKIAESLRNTEEAYVKMMSDPRIAKSLERSGRSARRVSQSFKAALGRTKARSAATVDDQVDQSLGLLEEISDWRRRQDREATMKIGLEPQRAADPPKPVFEKGPSLFSSLMKIAVGAAQGYLMGNELKDAGLFQGGGGKIIQEGATKTVESTVTSSAQGLAEAGQRYSSGTNWLRHSLDSQGVILDSTNQLQNVASITAPGVPIS
tara:strand:+ start:120 stop:992 length:873 start_codon:yes stop_codon:yes gene_type:complete